jgi:hypothetical protein
MSGPRFMFNHLAFWALLANVGVGFPNSLAA